MEMYRSEHNRRFAIEPTLSGSAWRANETGRTPDEVCALRYVRQVQNNNTVRVANVVLDIPKQPGRGSFAKALVDVRHLLRGGVPHLLPRSAHRDREGPTAARHLE